MSRAAVFVGLSACWSNAAPTEKTIVADDKSHAIATDARPAPPTGASLYGVVSDGVAALPHAMVELRDANGRIAATNTDERGAYRLEGIVAGDYQIIVQYGGGDEVGSTQRPVTVRDVGSQLDLTLKVHRRVPVAKPYGAPPARRRTV